MSDLISVIIPIYNAERTILHCVESLRKQTYKNIELILINDGSTDKTQNIITNIEKQYKYISAISTPHMGVSYARNLGIEKSGGEFIVFVDADDYVCEDYIEKLHSAAKKYTDMLAVCGMRVVGGNIDKIRVFDENEQISTVGVEKTMDMYAKYLLASPTNKIYRKDILSKNIHFNKNYSNGEDLIFNFEYIKYVSGFCIVNSPLYVYNISGKDTLHSKCDAGKFDMIKRTYNILTGYVYDNRDKVTLGRLICEEYIYSIHCFAMSGGSVRKTIRAVIKSREYKAVIKYIDDICDNKKFNFIIKLNNSCIISIYFMIKRLCKRG